MFLRKATLAVGAYGASNPSPGVDLSALQFTFTIRRGDTQTPNAADIRVYNVSQDTINTIQRQFDRVILQAGYEDNFGVIFDGKVKQYRTGHESEVDSYLDITAADGDSAYNFALVNTTLAAGSTAANQIGAVTTAMAPYGVAQGYTAALPTTQQTRGKVMFGMARDEMRKISNTTGNSWSIQNGQLQLVPLTGYIPGEVVVLTSATGLIGFPEQTPSGIVMKCLINPKIQMGGLIQIDNASIQKYRLPLNLPAQTQTLLNLATINNDGLYRVFYVEYIGNTRGNEWYTEIVCLDVNQGITPSLIQKQSVNYYG
jgi:hypothetical protein